MLDFTDSGPVLLWQNLNVHKGMDKAKVHSLGALFQFVDPQIASEL